MIGEYERGLQDAREAIEAGIESAEAERAQLGMPEVADKGRVITGMKTARGLVIALQRGERPYWRAPKTEKESREQVRHAVEDKKHVLDELAKH